MSDCPDDNDPNLDRLLKLAEVGGSGVNLAEMSREDRRKHLGIVDETMGELFSLILRDLSAQASKWQAGSAWFRIPQKTQKASGRDYQVRDDTISRELKTGFFRRQVFDIIIADISVLDIWIRARKGGEYVLVQSLAPNEAGYDSVHDLVRRVISEIKSGTDRAKIAEREKLKQNTIGALRKAFRS